MERKGRERIGKKEWRRRKGEGRGGETKEEQKKAPEPLKGKEG